MNNPLFSIVIPTYNHAHLISRCLDSLLAQSYPNWEAIVVNNFSQDNTVEVVQGYADPRIRIINNANGGIIAVSRNKGIDQSKGEWICLLDSDDWWTPNKLEQCLPYLEDYDMLYHDMQVYEQDIGLSKTLVKCRIPQTPFYLDLLKFGNCCPNSSVVIRKSIVDKVGPICQDKELVAVEDFDYWLRVSQITERFKQIDQILGYYWVGQTSISASPKWFSRHDALYEKHLPFIPIRKQRKQVNAWQQYRVAIEYSKLGQYKNACKCYFRALAINRLRSKLKIVYLLTVGVFKIKCNATENLHNHSCI